MFEDFSTLWLIALFSSFMLMFAYKDYVSYKNNQHQDYKSIIVSTGVLGTFVGIFFGLLEFDTSNIKDSVPILLEGLKMAFITSIEGMFLSILLSALQKNKGQGEVESELQFLSTINTQLDKLSILEDIDKKLQHMEILPLIGSKLNTIDTRIDLISKDIVDLKDELKENQKGLSQFLEDSLNKINQSLSKAIDTLAKGATEEIIKALEHVIQDFNTNLTEQFGDNFMQLNESVKNMIIWQQNYKNVIQELQTTLDKTMATLENTDSRMANIATHYQQIDATHSRLQSVIQTNENQINNLEAHLHSLGDIGEKAKSVNENQIRNLEAHLHALHDIDEKAKSINENQNSNLETHLNTLHDMGEKTKSIVDSMDMFADKVKGSLSNQSETLSQLVESNAKLKNEIEAQLPESLGQLNCALSSLTDKFRDDYNAFLQHVSQIMDINNRL
ncbi:hypothetical protein [Candidatus Albibeggiatoa sp. nov. NOAA]|uniref:hypothetical protein n=1 Tax=Candidatus Albibeggiatoa sp. nov. NOAA TaxID=3162724 RepID=UPI0032F36519|nr:hypothetical protein [Thiotrichaceae bacterium]